MNKTRYCNVMEDGGWVKMQNKAKFVLRSECCVSRKCKNKANPLKADWRKFFEIKIIWKNQGLPAVAGIRRDNKLKVKSVK